ncbi:MAG TPA: UvrD-helicase domain-containing protein [Streptosporangiaceae bacterium]|nr:UvrD-helicase domain-containing protein [Streptosporangiaceae bacterium]
MVAGGSARRRGQRAREEAERWARRSREANAVARRYEKAAEGERRAAAALLTLTAAGWSLLVDRRWRETQTANVDMILIGPAGIFVIDVKSWHRAPAVSGERLSLLDERLDAEVPKLLAITRTAEEHVAPLGVAPIAVRPTMIFTGHRLNARYGRTWLLGQEDAVPALLDEPTRLTAPMIRAVATHLADTFREYETSSLSELNGAAAVAPEETISLFDPDDAAEASLRAALRAPIERWMTFLHPDQIALTRRHWNGPARLSGPTGTGKTVVGLHRAAYLAELSSRPILYVTFVRNLPRVQEQLFRQLCPAAAERAEFTHLHAWVQSFLAERGVAWSLNKKLVDHAFAVAWQRYGTDSVLTDVDPAPAYWQDEINRVIKGRGLTLLEDYRAVRRHGRRMRLRPAQREAVWLLYEEYEVLRKNHGVHDFNDVLVAALDELRRRPLDRPYASVIVDEVQDLTLIGVRLLHALAGDGPNGLLLIGDGQQAVYPGGFRLVDAGIAVKGRGGVLRTNYRNADQILRAAMAIVRDDPFEDLEEMSSDGRRDIEAAYHDGAVVNADADDRGTLDELLIEAIRDRPAPESAPADAAVLCATRRELDHYHRILTRAGIPVLRLENYDGRPVDAIKLGTYRRAKGLEFKRVFLPQYDAMIRAGEGAGAADHERAELARRQLFVAMTRARDLLWLGRVANTARIGP